MKKRYEKFSARTYRFVAALLLSLVPSLLIIAIFHFGNGVQVGMSECERIPRIASLDTSMLLTAIEGVIGAGIMCASVFGGIILLAIPSVRRSEWAKWVAFSLLALALAVFTIRHSLPSYPCSLSF